MEFKRLKSASAMVMTFLGIKSMPVVDGKIAFDEDQSSKLKEELTEEKLTQLVDAFNSEIAENSQIKGINKEITEILKGLSTEDRTGANSAKQKTSTVEEDPNGAAEPPTVEDNLAALRAKMEERDRTIKALIEDSEGDMPLAIIQGGKINNMVKNSATHLYASGKGYDAFEGRNWNKLAAGLSTSATDWADATEISKLNGDMELFHRQNPSELQSLHRDNFGLPSHWKRTVNVVDRIVSGTIVTGPITQGRKLAWLPKNKQAIQAEEGKVYPISIDAEFIGHLLSVIEASWVSEYNKEGSQAYKLTFVRFLLQEIDKQARTEDRIASIKAIHVETPDNATKPGKFINRQDGLLYLAWKAREIDKKYRAFSLGVPTSSNIVDYVDELINKLPLDVKNMPGLEMEMSPTWVKAYKRRYEVTHSLNTDYTGVLPYPKDFPNIKFVEVVDFEGSDFMVITPSNNVEILEYLPKEKSLYKFEMLKRILYVFADYKMGMRYVHIGNKVKPGDPDQFKVQSVWSNDVSVFNKDFFIPVFDNETGEIEARFNQLKVDDVWNTDITKISGLVPGQIVKIQGDNTIIADKHIKNNADIVLGSDFALNTGGTLTMVVMADGKLKELSRTAEPEQTVTVESTFETGVLDADNGYDYTFSGAENTAITEILNGVPAQQIKISGVDGANTDVTLSTTGNIKVASAVTLATAADSIELILVDGVWIEFNRTITA
ncbi:hypothetical protein [Flavicella sp.]|uniref:hypothetical protein n=1 Tax=Flavicella sp. TaxID=2957742 RepID=UPI00301829D4